MKLLTLSEVVQKANEYLDTKPIGKRSSTNEVLDRVINPSRKGYDNLIDTFVYERYVQIKIYDIDDLIEYQLVMRPWDNGFQFNTWFDGVSPISRSSHDSFGMKFSIEESEFFMQSTVIDLKDTTFSDIGTVKALMDRFYKHFDIIPVDCEV